jgi:lipopolysaccharide export LptBFGC system permease protein LptF
MLGLMPCVAITALVLTVLSGIINDNSSAWHLQRARLLAQLKQEQEQHLIIVRYGPQHSVNDEWVYNDAEIKQAKVIWARDMNPAQNCKLIKHLKDRRTWLLQVGTDEPQAKLKPYSTDLCLD